MLPDRCVQAGEHLVSSRHSSRDCAVAAGDCGECVEPDQFEWSMDTLVNEAPVIVCKEHQQLAPGWMYLYGGYVDQQPSARERERMDQERVLARALQAGQEALG